MAWGVKIIQLLWSKSYNVAKRPQYGTFVKCVKLGQEPEIDEDK